MRSCRFLAGIMAVLMILVCPVVTAAEEYDYTGAIITVSDLIFNGSDEAQLVFNLDKVPDTGILSLKLRVHYETDYLELVAFDIESLFGTVTNQGKLTANPFVVTWDTYELAYETGRLMTLTFKAGDLQNLPKGEELVYVECSWVNTYASGTTVPVEAEYRMNQPGVYAITAVDVNGDSRINTDDALYLLRHSMLPERYPVYADADLNGNGIVDGKDAELLYKLLG